ncbi:hypothetical protein [Evtepia gabavorous]|uniref:hypothetical protein n=1 Tax=Evtepia gabavorous TaxID=2211183 RepID=UPI003A8DC3F0
MLVVAFVRGSLPPAGTSLRLLVLPALLDFSMRISRKRLILYPGTKSAVFFSGSPNHGTGGRRLRFVFNQKQIGGRKMYDYRKSDYAINKNSPNIVYRFHNEILEITLEDYLKENPGKTEKDFAELKALSDQIYYEQDRAESAQTRKDDSLTGLEETKVCATRPLDEEWEEKLTEFQNRLYARRAFEKLFAADVLTEIQKRRFCLYVFKGLSIRQIGRLEGRSHQVVAKSLNLAIRKLKKFFAEQG